MGEPALSDELIDQLADRRWRLNNHYYVEDKYGSLNTLAAMQLCFVESTAEGIPQIARVTPLSRDHSQ
jgi:hypothetical protein